MAWSDDWLQIISNPWSQVRVPSWSPLYSIHLLQDSLLCKRRTWVLGILPVRQILHKSTYWLVSYSHYTTHKPSLPSRAADSPVTSTTSHRHRSDREPRGAVAVGRVASLRLFKMAGFPAVRPKTSEENREGAQCSAGTSRCSAGKRPA